MIALTLSGGPRTPERAFFRVGKLPTEEAEHLYHGVYSISACVLAEGFGRIPLPSICSPALLLVADNRFYLVMPIRAPRMMTKSGGLACLFRRGRRLDGVHPSMIKPIYSARDDRRRFQGA